MFWGEGVKGNGVAEVYCQAVAKVIFLFLQSSKLNGTHAKKMICTYDQELCAIKHYLAEISFTAIKPPMQTAFH